MMNYRKFLLSPLLAAWCASVSPALAVPIDEPAIVGEPFSVGQSMTDAGFRDLDGFFGAAVGPEYAYLQAAGDLYVRSHPLRLIIFALPEQPVPVGDRDNPVTNVRFLKGNLYVSKAYDRGGSEYFLVSEGANRAFEDLTGAFHFPAFAIAPSWPIRDIVEGRDRVYAVPPAGAHLLYENAEGEWVSVSDDDAHAGTTPLGDLQSAAIHDGVVLLGQGPGALTVEASELWRGELDASGTAWERRPEIVLKTPPEGDVLQTSRIPEIAANPRTGTFLVGADGVLRSEDAGRRFEYTLRANDVAEGGTLQIYDFLHPTLDARQVLAAGYTADGNAFRAFLAWSADDGQTWTDVTSILGDQGTKASAAVFFMESPGGEIFLGLVSGSVSGPKSLQFLRLVLPRALAVLFPEAEYGGQGWWQTDALGWIQGAHFPWVWIEQQEVWVNLSGASEENLWMWDRELGWIWTNRAVSPHFYRHDTASYLYYAAGTRSPRWYYDLEADSWMSVP